MDGSKALIDPGVRRFVVVDFFLPADNAAR
jgi:hypothetical protein